MFMPLVFALGLQKLISVSYTVWIPMFVVVTLFAVAILTEHIVSTGQPMTIVGPAPQSDQDVPDAELLGISTPRTENPVELPTSPPTRWPDAPGYAAWRQQPPAWLNEMPGELT